MRPSSFEIILAVIFALMTIGLIYYGALLWIRRKETNDYSRIILTVFSWFTSIFTFAFIFRIIKKSTLVYEHYLDPEHTFAPLLIQITFFFYPLSIIRSIHNPIRTYALLFSPPIIIYIVGMFCGIEYTSLYTFSDIWLNIGKPDVLLRILAVIVMIVYAFSLFLVTYDREKSRADHTFISRYALGFSCIGLILLAGIITHATICLFLHQLMCILFIFSTIGYELNERLPAPQTNITEVQEQEMHNVIDKLWIRITHLMVEQQEWRNPELSLLSLSSQLASNRTYINEAFRKFAGCTFSEYIMKCRIEYIVMELQRNPQSNLESLFSNAGYLQRSTAYRNFKKVMGISPTEYIENQRNKKTCK